MKIGFIVECTDEGPETKVYPRLARMLRSGIETEVEPLGSKADVINKCGRSANGLLNNSKCDRVIVIWDARPPWKEGTVTLNPAGEILKVASSLEAFGLSKDKRVKLICVIEELEAWLLADGRGITFRINELRGKTRPLKKILPDTKAVETIDWPKKQMAQIFVSNKARSYEAWYDAERICVGIPTSQRLLKNSSVFKTFAEAITV